MILAAILTYLLTKGKKKHANDQILLYRILLVVSILMYGLNVYMEDSLHRPHYKLNLTREAVLTIVNTPPENTTWYTLTFNDQKNELVKISKIGTRWSRKLLLALLPNFTQIIYYFIPSIFLLFLLKDQKKIE